MRKGRVGKVIAVFLREFLAVAGSATLQCNQPVPHTGQLIANPTSLSFANAQSPAQQLTLSGGAPQYSDSSVSATQECFASAKASTTATSVTYNITPQTSPMNACSMLMYAQGTPILTVPIAVGVQMQPNASTSYTAELLTSTSGATLQSSNANIVTVPASVTATTSSTLPPVVIFTIKSGAMGSAVIHVYENGTSSPASYSIPVLVTSAPSPSPTPVATSTPTSSPTTSPSTAPTTTPTAAPTTTPTAAPTATPAPSGSTFTLVNSTNAQNFSLVGSPVAAQLFFYGQVSISGATSEAVTYSEIAGVPANGCTVSGTIVDAISLTFSKPFTFVPNGSFGANSGLLDTLFSPASPSGTYYGAIYQAGSCSTPFDAAAQAVSSPPSSYEYPGGGNTSVPAGTLILELYH